jgi:hypothetical protein
MFRLGSGLAAARERREGIRPRGAGYEPLHRDRPRGSAGRAEWGSKPLKSLYEKFRAGVLKSAAPGQKSAPLALLQGEC